MKKNRKLFSALSSLLISSFIVGCNSGGDGSSGSTFNPQPDNVNNTNYFSTYPISGGNEFSNTIFQVQRTNGVPTTLAIFSLSTYNSSSQNNTALGVYNLSANTSAGQSPNNYILQSTSTSPQNIGYLKIESNNNIILNASLSFNNGSGSQGEKATILIATEQQQNLVNNSYIGHCFNAPVLLGVSSNQGNDTCLYNIGENNSLQITDMAQNNTGPAINLCSSSSTWSQSIINPYFYNLNCVGNNGSTLTIQTTFTKFNNATLMTYLIPYNFSGNANTVYVGSGIPQSSLSTFTDLSNLQQMNLLAAGSISQQAAILSNTALISSACATFGQSTGTCPLSSYTAGTNIPLGVKNLQTPTSISTYPQIIGSSALGLFVDNNQYSYYFN